MENYDDFCTPVDKIPGHKGPLFIKRTSGSTGVPISVPVDSRCQLRRIAAIKYENEKLNFRSFCPLLHIRSLAHYRYGKAGKYKSFVYNSRENIYYASNFNLSDSGIKDILELINGKQIEFVRGYVTSLDSIADYAISHHIKLPLKPSFIAVGEKLLASTRDKIVNGLGCNVVSQYATEEFGVLGQSDINPTTSEILLNRANCFVEILKDDNTDAAEGELGRIIITDFTNYAMPHIRYDTGDVALAGRYYNGELLSIKNIVGRRYDLIYTTSGRWLDFFNSVPYSIYSNAGIRQWQFIQNEAKRYTLKLNLAAGAPKVANEGSLRSELKALLGEDAQIDIEYVDNVPVLNSGKRRMVVNAMLTGK